MAGAMAGDASQAASTPAAVGSAVRLLLCVTPSLLFDAFNATANATYAAWPAVPLPTPVEVSANAVDFSSGGAAAVHFTYSAPIPGLAVTSLLPPTGPILGGTRVLISGQSTAGYSDLRCRFGSGSAVEVAGTASPPDPLTTIACTTPGTLSAGGAPVHVSLNGQQWIAASSIFVYAEPARLDAVLPELSPNVGGLVLELTGAGLAGGSDYRCGFGHAGRSAAWLARHEALGGRAVTAATIGASFDVQTASVLCMSPAGMLGHVRVSVSLNGQQYSGAATAGERDGGDSASGVLFMTFYDPDGEELPPYGGDSGMAQVTSYQA